MGGALTSTSPSLPTRKTLTARSPYYPKTQPRAWILPEESRTIRTYADQGHSEPCRWCRHSTRTILCRSFIYSDTQTAMALAASTRLGSYEVTIRTSPASLMKVFLGALLAVFLAQCAGVQQQTTATPSADWPMYRRDLAGTGYSPLTQITTSNAANLTRVWSYSLESVEPAGDGRGPNSQATPIVVDDVLYLTAADRVVALEPTTGREIWRHPVVDGGPSRRGLLGRRGWHAPRALFSPLDDA